MTTKTNDPFLTLATSDISPAQLLYSDVPSELATTRRVLERVPDGHSDWQPHPKSMTLGRLATHISELPRFVATILSTDELDFAKSDYRPTTLATTAEILAQFDKLAAGMQTELASASWENLAQPWKMRSGDQVFISGQKGKLIRTICISHSSHHRAQLGVYLRLLGVSVPGVYGPSADEM